MEKALAFSSGQNRKDWAITSALQLGKDDPAHLSSMGF